MSRKELSKLWELYQSENTLRHVRVSGVVIWDWFHHRWTTALNAIALNYLTMFALPAATTRAGRSSRLKAQKRSPINGLSMAARVSADSAVKDN